MDTKIFIVKILKIISWPGVILILGLRVVNIFLSESPRITNTRLSESVSLKGFNSVLSGLGIILAIIALIPYIIEICFYFRKKPKFEVQIADKKISKRGKETVFDFFIVIKPTNVSLLLKRIVLSLPFEVTPEQPPSSTKKITIISPEEGTEFGATILLDYGAISSYPKLLRGYFIRVVFIKKIDAIKITLTVESEIDVLKMGVWSIFYRAREYRNQKIINILADNKRQEITI